MITGAIPMNRMITHEILFSRLEEGFRWLLKPPEGYLKGIVLFGETASGQKGSEP